MNHPLEDRDAALAAPSAAAYAGFRQCFPSDDVPPTSVVVTSGAGVHATVLGSVPLNNTSIADSGYAASIYPVEESNAVYRSQRWEIKRARSRLLAPRPDRMSTPVSGFPTLSEQRAQRKSDRKRLPPGIRRTRNCTYVTTHDGLTAIYCRKAKVFPDWKHDEDGNLCSTVEELIYPWQDGFESDPDDD